MQFKVKRSTQNPRDLIRKCGYHCERSLNNGELSFGRRIGIDSFPKFQLYLKEDKEKGDLILNLHLDQKIASYQGAAKHSGEYGGKIIEKEVGRIKSIIMGM